MLRLIDLMKKIFTGLCIVLSFINPAAAFADITQNIAVSATINPHASDFQFAISATPNALTSVNQFQNIIYTITYGSHLSYATPITIVGSWDKGTIQGQSSPSVDIANYVIGSATNAYNNTIPVIDTVNKTITWTITSFPANTTSQTVGFTLQTNADYASSQTVTFPAIAHLSVTGVT